MKVKKSGLLIAMIVAAGAALPTASFASDGTITFTGEITATTCQISGNGGGSSFTVALDKVSTTALPTDKAAADAKPFNIVLSQCTPASGNAAVYFEPGATVDSVTGQLLNATGSAQNVEIGLLNSDYSKINLGQGSQTQNVKWASIASGSATFTYYAQYVAAGGAAKAGTVNTSTLYSIIYQ
jgi:major type 1 subunit fimbrin (pilin)